MTKDNNSHSKDSTSSGNLENVAFSLFGLELTKLYALDSACEVLRLSDRFKKKIRVKYLNKGILKLGDSFVCIGSDLLRILTAESESDE